MLRDLGIDQSEDDRVVEVLNKIDLLDSGARNALLAQAARNDHMQAVSALTGEGLNELFGLLDRHMTADRVTVDLCVRIEDGAALAWLHDRGDVLERHDDEEFAHLTSRWTRPIWPGSKAATTTIPLPLEAAYRPRKPR